MADYDPHLAFYFDYWFSLFSSEVPEINWGKKDIAEEYLRKYWLPEKEYDEVWKPLQDQIFINQSRLPELSFNSDFWIIALRGGGTFSKRSFEDFSKAIKIVGGSHFVVIQNTQVSAIGEPMFRMKFPIEITWEELMSGNYISAVVFEMHYNEYFIFGDNPHWGRYAANEHESPLNLIGVSPKYAPVFHQHIEQSIDERNEMRKWLPENYRGLLCK